MNRPVRTGKISDEARARILEAAEELFRCVGYHRTSVADIAAGLGMSPANIYRFFPSRDAIDEAICGRVVNEVADIAHAIARTNAPATAKLDRLLTAVHHHAKMMPVNARPMHALIVAATQQNWPIINAHNERMLAIFEAIIREGVEAVEFEVDDTAQAARAVRSAFTAFLHPILIEHFVQHCEESDVGLRDQIRFILKALRKSG
jgi:AcrR family transcriptional regulator